MRNGRQQENDGARLSVAAIGAWWRGLGLICLVLAVTMTSPAQDDQTSASKVKFKVLVNFNELSVPNTLAQGSDGNLYGTSLLGGANSAGTIYRMTPTGTLTTIYNFCSQPNCADGGFPGFGALALGIDGNFYGTTGGSGANASGTIFKITPNGTLTTLYNICSQANCADGVINNGLTLGADGNIYGTMMDGGANSNPLCIEYGSAAGGCGTVFKITQEGAFSTVYDFCSQTNCSDGANPYFALTAGADGNLYGIAWAGGANGDGTIFKLTLGGTLTTLHSFDGTDGTCLSACLTPLVQAPDGNFYGVTQGGGTGGGFGGVFFRISPSGTYAVLYNFCSLANCADGDLASALVYADGNFYGAANGGGNTSTPICGSGGCGTLFKITPKGVLKTLHAFNGTTDGFSTLTLAQATNGVFYGADTFGGTYNAGTIYALSAGLGPFVELLPTLGKVGKVIRILGTDLNGATSVSFNGTDAGPIIVSNTEITATVPAGATTGFVTATTPTRTLKSNVKFQVRP